MPHSKYTTIYCMSAIAISNHGTPNKIPSRISSPSLSSTQAHSAKKASHKYNLLASDITVTV